jgi:hypothetical protein
VVDFKVVEHKQGKKLRQGNWEQTSVSTLPDTDVVMYPVRINKLETVTMTMSKSWVFWKQHDSEVAVTIEGG